MSLSRTTSGAVSRTVAIAANLFRQAVRARVLYLVGLYALGLVAAGALLPQVAANTEDKMLLDVGLGAIALIGLAAAIFLGTSAIPTEISKRTLYVLLAKPVTPAEIVVGKHLGLSAVLGALVAAMTLIYLLQLTLSATAYHLGSLLLAAGYTWLELSLMVAVALLASLVTGPLLAVLVTLAVYLIGQLSPDLVAFSQLTDSPLTRRLMEGLYIVLPDLSRLNWRNQAVYGPELLPEPLALVGHGLYGLLYMFVLLAIASLLLSRREI
ncbi:MAG: ABC transporter permease [Cyanobacteria bacterium P01_A01_bin.135]